MRKPIKVKVIVPGSASVGTVLPQNSEKPECELFYDKDGVVAVVERTGRRYLIPWTNIVEIEFIEVDGRKK